MGALAQVFEFKNKPITVYTFRGKLAWVAQDVGAALGYTREGFQSTLRSWQDEFITGQDIEVLRGASLKEFFATVNPTVAKSSTNQTILYESGLNLVCLKTDKPFGRDLRRWFAETVMPAMRTGTLTPSHAAALAELFKMTLCLAPRPEAETVWEIPLLNELARLRKQRPWDGVSRFPTWPSRPIHEIYLIVLGEQVREEQLVRNPKPQKGSLQYQMLTEARHSRMKQHDMDKVFFVAKQSRTWAEFINKLSAAYERAPLQLSW